MGKRMVGAVIMLALVGGGSVASAEASTSGEVFRRAHDLIQEAEASLGPDTNAWIRQKLAEAKGVLTSAETGNLPAEASQGTPGGKYSLSNAELQALWAESVARDVIFITTRKLR